MIIDRQDEQDMRDAIPSYQSWAPQVERARLTRLQRLNRRRNLAAGVVVVAAPLVLFLVYGRTVDQFLSNPWYIVASACSLVAIIASLLALEDSGEILSPSSPAHPDTLSPLSDTVVLTLMEKVQGTPDIKARLAALWLEQQGRLYRFQKVAAENCIFQRTASVRLAEIQAMMTKAATDGASCFVDPTSGAPTPRIL